MAAIGAALIIVGVFLPATDSRVLLSIADNTLVEGGDGVIMAILAAAAGISAYTSREGEGRNLVPLVCGLIIGALSLYAGSSIELENGFGNPVEGDPGVGLYAVGAGALFLVIAGLTSRDPD